MFLSVFFRHGSSDRSPGKFAAGRSGRWHHSVRRPRPAQAGPRRAYRPNPDTTTSRARSVRRYGTGHGRRPSGRRPRRGSRGAIIGSSLGFSWSGGLAHPLIPRWAALVVRLAPAPDRPVYQRHDASAAHCSAPVLHCRRGRPCARRGAAAIALLVDAGNGPPATRLSKGRLLFRDDALAAWLAERGMRLVA